jgi:TrmH family RNA methyltransferase
MSDLNSGGYLTHPLGDLIHIVLVETEESLNIGSVARAMKNLGFTNLHLVKPVHFSIEKAEITGRWALDVLQNARIHESLEECLKPMTEVIGFSGREGKNRANLMLPEWVQHFRTRPLAPTALVFGPEDTGLRHDHVEHCRWLVRIPTSAEYPSFNLAQAVLLGLFELSRQDWSGASTGNAEHAADWNQFYQLDKLVDAVLEESGFYRVGTPEPIPGLVKNLFRRTNPDKREMGVLLALFARIRKTIERREQGL